MRGAALKFGQLLSSFEEVVVPEPLRSALENARQDANAMPRKQLLSVLTQDFGKDWETLFTKFDIDPFAAASIGQVHLAEIEDKESIKTTKLAVKVQFPGVATSIESDLYNLKTLFKYLNLVPKGLYIDKVVDNLGSEIKEECNYILEGEKQMRYYDIINSCKYLSKIFTVPKVIQSLSSNNVLTTEFIEGVNVDEMENESQEVRDYIGEKLLELCLKEIFIFKFMQTDPNPANFFISKRDMGKPLSKENTDIGLIDFGAAREYSDNFVNTYMKIVYNARENRKEETIKYSQDLGFLTGFETDVMLDAHANSVIAIAEPFMKQEDGELFNFGNQDVTKRIYKELPVMLKHRLTSPPTEVYSLHRRLSGVYLTCIKLRSKV
eukprot:CAMPEP_0170531416 /NCGR_PEP_ID=MMETSP0209-20121228/61628_1 /TAXON_ID=665100 ORGANISM="Litonotus pictus, Strain P1" /NCGR_SAMPLE_ID=MMETSP0209 /ASSEMBLY_ACC=CAM_ASM_000301 /LENGTH=379 /DNA_ID=CAMNT_0010826027 /DNA_START=528 /DNA_END=1663 /DNA_ORIENTATION=+